MCAYGPCHGFLLAFNCLLYGKIWRMADEDSATQAMSWPVAANTAAMMLGVFKLKPTAPTAKDPVHITWYWRCITLELDCEGREGRERGRGGEGDEGRWRGEGEVEERERAAVHSSRLHHCTHFPTLQVEL